MPSEIHCISVTESAARPQQFLDACVEIDFDGSRTAGPHMGQFRPEVSIAKYYAEPRRAAIVVELKGVSLHSLRHNITLSIYNHAIPADRRAAAKVWDDGLGDVIGTSKKPAKAGATANYCTGG